MMQQVTTEDVRNWRVLTIKQPWAASIFAWRGRKDVENRSWVTSYRGPLIIHAGASFDKAALTPERGIYTSENAIAKAQLTRNEMSRVVGVVMLHDIVTTSKSDWALPGNFHWCLQAPYALEPIAGVAGKLGLWRPDDVLARRIAKQLTDASWGKGA